MWTTTHRTHRTNPKPLLLLARAWSLEMSRTVESPSLRVDSHWVLIIVVLRAPLWHTGTNEMQSAVRITESDSAAGYPLFESSYPMALSAAKGHAMTENKSPRIERIDWWTIIVLPAYGRSMTVAIQRQYQSWRSMTVAIQRQYQSWRISEGAHTVTSSRGNLWPTLQSST
jgi:hypothetical protein